MKATLRNSVAIAGLISLSTVALAQYNGPGKRAPEQLPVLRTVSEVLAKPVDDQPVRLTGTLIRQIGNETFQFRDASGEIQVEIDDDDFPRGQAVGAETRVTLVGEVETRVMRAPEIDAEQLIVTPAEAPAAP
jgi:uncharacterized protein (TIGR00156 family)